MELQVAACGLLCNFCPAYTATKNNDAALIAKTAQEWSVFHGVEVKPEDVWCTGCMTEGGRKCAHCAAGCEIRKCITQRGYPTCAVCPERKDCKTISQLAQSVPPTVLLLDALAGFKKQFAPEK